MDISLASPQQHQEPAPWLIPALGALMFLTAAAIIRTSGVATTLDALREASTLWVLHLLILLPVLWIVLRSPTRSNEWDLLLWSLTAYTLAHLLLYAPRVSLFAALQWNWQGKFLAIIATLLIIFGLGRISPAEFGLRLRLHPGAWRPFLLAAGICAVLMALGGWNDSTTTETLLYQWTMPGLEEELLYRGVLLVLLNRAFGTPWRWGGAQVGWGVVLTSVLFGAAHAFAFDHNGAIQVLLIPGIVTGCTAVLFGWIQARTGSLWTVILLHNIVNGVAELAALFSGGIA